MSIWDRVTRSASGGVGLGLVGLVVGLALFGPLLAPHPPGVPVGPSGSGPGAGALLGTDTLGRDVLSRVLWGGATVLLLPGLATGLAYAVGGTIGLVAGHRRSVLEQVLMRGMDVLRAFPPLLLLLVLITGAGSGKVVLVLGVAAVQIAPVARLVHTATLETSTRGHVEAAVARGERTTAILGREILPNITSAVLADAGLRFTFSILLAAAVNFLNLGLDPPAADWALMISENRPVASLNPLATFVPVALIASLTVGLNLVGDAVAVALRRSSPATVIRP
jgi:peptide/nickel transport system permease protein